MDTIEGMDSASAISSTADRLIGQALCAQSHYMPDVRTDVGPLTPGWTTAQAFFADEAAVAQFLEFERALNRGTDLKSAGAFLMGDYGYIVAAATVPLFVGFGLVPDLSVSTFALSFYTAEEVHEGHSHAIRRAHVRYLSPAFTAGDAKDDRHADVFRNEIERHFRPVVETLFSKTGLSRSALWRLAADSVAGRFLDAGRHFGCIDAAKASAMRILKQPGSPLNNRQLHYFDLTVLDGEQRDFTYTFRARGGCCRFYLVDGGEYCPTCVLLDPEERDERLRQAMRHHLGVA